jgi:hypothetical protein
MLNKMGKVLAKGDAWDISIAGGGNFVPDSATVIRSSIVPVVFFRLRGHE